ncbi:ATP-binding protein [Roseibacillus ishigakijimensis]|uniref:ATP-binding protein n=1 Tax=Roseibacillus ishigakijimensis TaxID=454146 RepID=A0A934VMN7_9BACT|nr:ATP-binding protein [Roseibacillus ishigakijimensis]
MVGPNAAGKSNLLDVFLFLKDLAKSDGGLQQAVESRGTMKKLRSLFARSNPKIEIGVELHDPDTDDRWTYHIAISQEQRGHHRPIIAAEKVTLNGKTLCDRPDPNDRSDPERLTQTWLEQISLNKDFRPLASIFQQTNYLHLVPQLLKFPTLASREGNGHDPFGVRFLQRMMETTEKTRRSRLRKIERALQVAVPEFKDLLDVRDEITGQPHLEATYRHWRPNGARQREDQFSDGTLRLIGLLWSLLDGRSLLLLEEPEVSLHSDIIRELPSLMWRVQRETKTKRQLFVSTHSYEMLSDKGIRPSEILILEPSQGEGTKVSNVADIPELRTLLQNGLSPADSVLPRTRPGNLQQLSLFE